MVVDPYMLSLRFSKTSQWSVRYGSYSIDLLNYLLYVFIRASDAVTPSHAIVMLRIS